MIDKILEAGNPVSPESELWLRQTMQKRDRYKNLEPKIDRFTVEVVETIVKGRYRVKHLMVVAWRKGYPRPIPVPKKELLSNHSTKSRVLARLRKVIDHQMIPHRVKGYHVDHIYPFDLIVQDWLALRGLTWDKVTSRHYTDFDIYHQTVATYQLLTPEQNLKKSNKLC